MLTDAVIKELSSTVLLRCPHLALTTRVIGDADVCSDLWPLERRHGSGLTPSVVMVDCMRTTPSIPGLIGRGETMFFVEATDGPGIARFDVSGFLWRSGISVIDIDRLVIADPDGAEPTQVVLGRARLTPERIEPQSKAISAADAALPEPPD